MEDHEISEPIEVWKDGKLITVHQTCTFTPSEKNDNSKNYWDEVRIEPINDNTKNLKS